MASGDATRAAPRSGYRHSLTALVCDQLQGGRVPSWHTTVVEPFAGTTTVVFAGSGGLELLMQPLNMPAASSAPAARTGVIETFIIASLVPAACRPYRFMLSEALSSRQRRTA